MQLYGVVIEGCRIKTEPPIETPPAESGYQEIRNHATVPYMSTIGIEPKSYYTSHDTDNSSYLQDKPLDQSTVSQDEPHHLRCLHSDCASDPPTFYNRGEWEHSRPFICKIGGCDNILGFKHRSDLKRHQYETHANPRDKLCPYLDCARSMDGGGFTRRSNLVLHLRRVHNFTEGEEQIIEEDTPENGSSRMYIRSSSRHRRPPNFLFSKSQNQHVDSSTEEKDSRPLMQQLHPYTLALTKRPPKRKRGDSARIADAFHLSTTNITTDATTNTTIDKTTDIVSITNAATNTKTTAVHPEDQDAEIQRLKRFIADKDAQIDLLKDMVKEAFQRNRNGSTTG